MSKILIISNKYQYFGGTEQVVINEIELLKKNGNQVKLIEFDNNSIKNYNFIKKIFFLFSCFYSFSSKNIIKKNIDAFKPDYIHVHNIFPLISLSIYSILKKSDALVFQSIHDHRLAGLCPQGNAYKSGKFCDKCFDGNYFNAVFYKCIKNNIILSAIYAFNIYINRKFKIMEKSIDYAIVFNQYLKNKLIETGFDRKKIFEKPHFIDISTIVKKSKNSNYLIYIGAISNHKGIFTLVKAFNLLKNKISLKVVGDGDSYEDLKKYIQDNNLKQITLLGEVRDLNKKFNLIGNALATIIPSECPETFCLAAIESMGVGVPVICSKIGSLQYLVTNKYNGFNFRPMDYIELAEKIDFLIDNYKYDSTLSINAKKDFNKYYNSEKNYKFFEELFLKSHQKRK
tara:strand:+ start:1558 stop:2754 length:1197 start_codon:yes stop_codon:yes gene_type:complete